MNLTTLVNTENYILFELPQGKPDSKEICNRETLEQDRRSKVKQAANKNATCWYYSFNTIRFRFGENVSEEFYEQRKFEKILSQRRKLITEFNNEEDLIDLLTKNPYLKEPFLRLNHTNVKNFSFYKLYPVIFDKFLEQNKYSNAYEYITNLKHDEKSKYLINKSCLKQLDTSPKEQFERAIKEDTINYTNILISMLKMTSFNWKDLPFDFKNVLTDTYVKDLSAKLYNLKISKWSPKKSFDFFIDNLRNEGPIVVGGNFGHSYYNEHPTVKEKFNNIPIYGWSPGSRIDSLNAHTITIIGAQKFRNQEFVYYIDPNDASDPVNPQIRKIYKISYLSLTKFVMANKATWGVKYDLVPSVNGYGYAMNNFTLLS